MLLKNFINTNNITIRETYVDLCESGIYIMRESLDVNHDENHIHEILSELDKFLKIEKEIAKKIDYESLLTAICWHDVWMSKREQTTSILKLVLERTYEGFGSSMMFRSHLKRNDIGINKYWKIQKLIVYHTDYKFVPLSQWISKNIFNHSLELRILKDIDFVAGLSKSKIKRIVDNYIKKGNTDPLLFRAAYFYLKNYLIKNDPEPYFESINKKLQKEWDEIMIELVEIFNELISNKEYYFNTNSPYYSLIENFEPNKEELEFLNKYST